MHHQIPPRASADPRLPSDPRLAVEIAAPADHFDWLIETPYPPGTTPTDDDRTLICFRCAQRPDILIARGEPFTAERLADHRRLYLHYEGELSDNRGTVTRIAEGTFQIYEISPRVLVGEIDFARRLFQNPTKPCGTGVPPVAPQPRTSGSETGSKHRNTIRATRTSDHPSLWRFEFG